MTAMNKTNDNVSNKEFNRINWSFLQSSVENKEVINSVLKFHYSTINRTLSEIKNYDFNPNLNRWLDTVVSQDVLPQSYEEKIGLVVNVHKQYHSALSFNKTKSLNIKDLGQLLFDAFGRESAFSSKRYPSAGALYPVIPLLLILDTSMVENGLIPGCYVYDCTSLSLLRIRHWNSEQLAKVISFFTSGGSTMSPYCLAYSVDIRRAVNKYQRKGYRHAMIEIGLMAQSFRESINNIEDMGERCWSGFQDLSLTHSCGLNIRLSPITLVQWFGFTDKI